MQFDPYLVVTAIALVIISMIMTLAKCECEQLAERFIVVPRDSVSDQVLLGNSAYDKYGTSLLHAQGTYPGLYPTTAGTVFDTTLHQI